MRDLGWTLASPALFTQIPEFAKEWLQQDYIDRELWPWLHSVDQKPEALLQHLNEQRSRRLGIYFEQLLSFYFEQYPRFNLLAKNLQVNNEQRTLGEFDFIVEDKNDGTIKHFEAAVKFYLGHNNYRGQIKQNKPYYDWHNWVGPNQKDTLAIKMRHLEQHQLPLPATSHGQDTLSKLGLNATTISSRLLIKGQFYSPLNSQLTLPRFSNSDLLKPYWTDTRFLFENPSLLEKDLHYCILPRSLWLSEITRTDIEDKCIDAFTSANLINEIKDTLAEGYNEWQIAALDLRLSRPEKKRFFLVNSYNYQ